MSRPKRVVLLADPNAVNRSCWTLVLETRGYRVLPAATEAEALAWIELSPEPYMPGHSIDVMVAVAFDLGLNGCELARRARALQPEMPVVLFGRGATVGIDDTVCAAFLPTGVVNAATVIERVQVLAMRKRGPKRRVVPALSAEVVESMHRMRCDLQAGSGVNTEGCAR